MKVLVANRGEIAIRILRACREMGIPGVAIYSESDQTALHVRYAEEAVPVGGRDGYLAIPAIVEAARRTGADAVHPGYGFLSENPDFARAVEEAGLTFIGPRPETIDLLGDKLAARRAAREAGLPVLPGTDEALPENLPPEAPEEMAAQVPFPLLVKAARGGGGRGIRLALSPEDLPGLIEAARAEALAAFGDGSVYLESMVQQARHIEVQILGDGQGKVLCLGERECSIQRRRQKLIEEAPAAGLNSALRTRLYEAALTLAQRLNYRSLGTVEFLLDGGGDFHFIEVNPRIQVEHPVTEMVTGMDLVREQLSLALGGGLRVSQEQVELRGAAIEARILAEDPRQDFLPSTGQVSYLKEPGGAGIRVDSAVFQGMLVGVEYDSLLAKVIAWGENRPAAIRRLQRGLLEYQVGGVQTDIEFLLQIIESAPFQAGNLTTTYLESFKPEPAAPPRDLDREIALVAALFAHTRKNAASAAQAGAGNSCLQSAWRQAAWKEQMRGSA